MSKVGGASGPLWGTALRRAGRSLGDAEALDGPALADALDAALAGIVELGAAQVGDKTMVDALTPATQALRAAVEARGRLAARRGPRRPTCRPGALDRASTGAQGSRLGPRERSIGHEDPGAAPR